MMQYPYMIADLSDGGILIKCSRSAISGIKNVNAYT
jgi:hypothetical protein